MEEKCSLPEMLPKVEGGTVRGQGTGSTGGVSLLSSPQHVLWWALNSRYAAPRKESLQGAAPLLWNRAGGVRQWLSEQMGHSVARVVLPEYLWIEVMGVLRRLNVPTSKDYQTAEEAPRRLSCNISHDTQG